ncbi:MAG: DUF998 domain-containing protein [Candidatus Hodarchaeota archaeon]
MKGLKLSINKILQSVSGGIFGLLSITFGFTGDIIAFLLFPGYDFTKKAVSYLCKGPGGIYFQIGSIFSGIFAVLFVISLGRTFDEDGINEKLRKNTIYIALVSCISLIILGAFCGPNPIIALIHGVFAFISWLFGLFYISLFSLLMMKDSKFPKNLAYLGFIVSFLLLVLLILFILHFFEATNFLVLILPSIEWIDTLAIIFWYFIVSTYMIYNKI